MFSLFHSLKGKNLYSDDEDEDADDGDEEDADVIHVEMMILVNRLLSDG